MGEILGLTWDNVHIRDADIAADDVWIKKTADLPNVVFHSLHHSSTTEKLKLNHGDLKAAQGDTGHAEGDMITQVYAHILDEDRKINAQ